MNSTPPGWDLDITSQNPPNSSQAHNHVDGGGGAITQNGKAWFRKAWTSSPNWSNSIITNKVKMVPEEELWHPSALALRRRQNGKRV